jgi:hypothetical protein
VVSTVDGRDLSIKDLKCCWYFICFVRDGCGYEIHDFVERFGRTPSQAAGPSLFAAFRDRIEFHLRDGVAAQLGWLTLKAEPHHDLSTSDNLEANGEAGEVAFHEFFADVSHNSPPAEISPREAEECQRIAWETSIEEHATRLANGSVGQISQNETSVIMLTFDRCTKELEDAILASPPAKAALERGVDVKPAWAGGAKIFTSEVTPARFEAPTFEGDLRPWHVVLCEADEPALLKALEQLPVRYKKLKPQQGRTALPSAFSLFDGSEFSDDSESDEEEEQTSNDATKVVPYRVVRTFIHVDITPKAELRSVQSL